VNKKRLIRLLILHVVFLAVLGCGLSAKSDYQKALQENLNAYADAFLDFAGAMQDVEINANTLNDEVWVTDVKTKLDAIQSAGNALGSIEDVPEEYVVIDDLMKLIKLETTELVNNFNQGLDSEDIGMIETAVGNMDAVQGYLDQAADQIEALK